jgi:hypothetical protein
VGKPGLALSTLQARHSALRLHRGIHPSNPQFASLPGIIGERIFSLFSTSQKEFLSQKDFVDGACRLFNSNFDDNLGFVFQIFDFDGDGFITKEDIRIVLSHVPLAQILQESKVGKKKEGAYTADGGG